MRVILQQDIIHLGQKDDIKDVKSGYARNFLFPQHLAKPATPQAIQQALRLKEQKKARVALHKDEFRTLISKFEGMTFTLSAKANEQGGLFRAISKKQIVALLIKRGIEGVTEEDIEIEHPIKKVGEHQIMIQRRDISVSVKLMIEEKKEK